jgi:TonB family protein
MNLSRRIPGIASLLLILFLSSRWAEASPKYFSFANPSYIITAEMASEHSFIVNYINLSDFVIVTQPNEFIYRAASGRFYIGQVFEQRRKDSRGEAQRYSASVLLKGHSFVGLTIVGAFHEQDQIEQLSVRIGSKRFYLQPMEKALFDQLASKIGELDLRNDDGAAALQQAGIDEIGTAKNNDGTPEWDRDWQDLITQDGVNAPKIIEKPDISSTEEALKTHTYGKVKISCVLNKNGAVQDLKILKGLGHGLDQKAMEGVKNSWLFLPATKNGEVLDNVISIEVDFPAPAKR